MRSTARPLTSLKAIIAYIIMLLVLLNHTVSTIANIDFVLTAKGNSRLVSIWNFLTTPKGNLTAVFLAVLWITALLLWPEKKSDEALSTTRPREQPLPKAKKSDAHESKESESTLACVNTRIANVEIIGEVCTESTARESFRAPVVAFSNKGNMASMKNYVKARITFYDSNGKHLQHVNNGVWLEEEQTSIQYFDVGEVRELVIALMKSNDEVYAFGKEVVSDIAPAGKQLRIEVSLVGGLLPATLGTFHFKLTLKPELRIEQEGKVANDGKPDPVTEGLIALLHEGEKLLYSCRGGRRTDLGFRNEIYVWELNTARFIVENYDETHEEIFMSHAPIVEYPIGEATPQEKELLNKIYTRLVRLQSLIEERRKAKTSLQ